MEEKLESLKKEYLKTKTPNYLKNYGWANLQSRLTDQKELGHLPLVNARRVILAFSILLIIFSIPLTFAQTSKPGQSLYQLKIASDKLTAKVTGDYETNIERRALEVIESSENGSSFDEASKQYQQTIDEAKQKAVNEDEKKKEELRKKLEEQERKFQNAKKESEKSKKRLEEVRNRTRQIRGEVKGDKDEEENRDNKGKDNEEENDKSGKSEDDED